MIEVGGSGNLGKCKKKAARTVNCPCREASDATCGKTRLPDQEPCSTHPVLLPLLIRCNSQRLGSIFFYRFGSHLASTTSTTALSVRGIHATHKSSLSLNPNQSLELSFGCYFGPFLASTLLWPLLEVIIRAAMTHSTEHDPIASPPDASNSVRPPRRKLWQTALLFAGSAAFGGLAVAFWNRKTLAEMRNRTPEPPHRTVGREDDIY